MWCDLYLWVHGREGEVRVVVRGVERVVGGRGLEDVAIAVEQTSQHTHLHTPSERQHLGGWGGSN